MKSIHSQYSAKALTAAALLVPALAQAHPGHPHAAGLLEGAAHPLLGMDHILAMVAVGLWAAQLGGWAKWLLPVTFVSTMAVGAILGMGVVQIPGIEQGIMASVLILGFLVARAVRLSTVASAAIVSLFALFHGLAHGAEMPATSSGLAYGLGFVSSTALMHCIGLALGVAMPKISNFPVIRFAGLAIAAGVFLL